MIRKKSQTKKSFAAAERLTSHARLAHFTEIAGITTQIEDITVSDAAVNLPQNIIELRTRFSKICESSQALQV